MTRGTRIALIIVVVLMVVCLCAAIATAFIMGPIRRQVGGIIQSNPADIAKVGSQIAQYEIPAGYEQGGFSLLDYSMIVIAPKNDSSKPIFMLMQIPATASTSREEMERSFLQMGQQQAFGNQNLTLRPAGTTSATIRGKQVTLAVQEGTLQTGQGFREMIGVFDGNNGPAMLMIMGPIDTWDLKVVDQFIRSFR